MTLLTEKSVRWSLDKLKNYPEHQEQFIMTNLQEPAGHALYNGCMSFTTKPEGKAPGSHSTMTGVTNLPSPLSALKGNKMCRLYQFLHNNGGYALNPPRRMETASMGLREEVLILKQK